MRCAACDDPGGGFAHTCSGSGTFLAAEAHMSGQIEEIAKDWPTWYIDLRFHMRGVDERMIREKLTPLVESLLSDELVDSSNFSIKPQIAA